MRRTGFLLAFGLALLPLASAQQTFTYVDLVKRVTDLKHLATLPAPGETTKQWSSYDRASKYDEQTGKYIRWDANGDGGGIIRKEGAQSVLAEMEGPGCIWRIWSATAKDGHVRIYLDGATEPAVDLPFIGYHAPRRQALAACAKVQEGPVLG
jgi:D-arabinan exo alpha-(1,3)/(1,5)-arabinofuranosidase (non-reducing end)